MKVRSRARLVVEAIEGATLVAVTLPSWPIARRWLRNWGSTAEEQSRVWPGDDLVAPAILARTRAITVEAPSRQVWSWVAQFGLDRAGFYSYELLERFVGIPVTNVESIESKWQQLSEGDEILLHPEAGILASRVEPGRLVCFGQQTSNGKAVSEPVAAQSWSIYVESVDQNSCRLVIRGRSGPLQKTDILTRIASAVLQPIDFVMEQRMLRTIKRLAENLR